MAIRTSTNVVFAENWVRNILTALADATPTINSLDGGEVHLFHGDLIPTPQMTNVDLSAEEATYGSYGAVTVTTLADVQTEAQQWALHKSVLFTMTLGTPEDTVTGYYFLDSDGDLVISERFAVPVDFSGGGSFLDLNMFIPMDLLVNITLAS